MKDQKNRMVNERDFRQDPHYVAPDKEKKKLMNRNVERAKQLGIEYVKKQMVK